MKKTVEGLIDEIREIAAGKIDARRLQEVTDEVRTHLDASIQSRLELGQVPGLAELEAIEAFGSAKSFVSSLLICKRPRLGPVLSIVATFLSTVAVTTLVWSVFCNAEESKTWAELAVLCAALPSVLAGWKMGRVGMKWLAGVGTTSLAAAAIALSIGYVAISNQGGFEPRYIVMVMARGLHVSEVPAYLDSQRSGFKKTKEAEIAFINSNPPPFNIPVTVNSVAGTSYKLARSRREALSILRQVEVKQEKFWESAWPIAKAVTADEQQELTTPFWLNTLRLLPITLLMSGAVFLFNLLAQTLGALAKVLSGQPPLPDRRVI